MGLNEAERLVKSKQRVSDHGEVFTPSWMVEEMLNHLEEESERIDARVLEPACGSGNFLVPALARKFATVQARYGKSDFEKRNYALFALMCLYGIELMADNIQECRDNLADLFNVFLGVSQQSEWAKAARVVLDSNIVQGNALTMTEASGLPITFAEWGYLGKGKFQRRDFRYDSLTKRSALETGGSLFQEAALDLFIPNKTHPTMTVHEIAEQVHAA